MPRAIMINPFIALVNDGNFVHKPGCDEITGSSYNHTVQGQTIVKLIQQNLKLWMTCPSQL